MVVRAQHRGGTDLDEGLRFAEELPGQKHDGGGAIANLLVRAHKKLATVTSGKRKMR